MKSRIKSIVIRPIEMPIISRPIEIELEIKFPTKKLLYGSKVEK